MSLLPKVVQLEEENGLLDTALRTKTQQLTQTQAAHVSHMHVTFLRLYAWPSPFEFPDPEAHLQEEQQRTWHLRCVDDILDTRSAGALWTQVQ